MHDSNVERRVQGSSIYEYNGTRIHINEPTQGDNRTLIYTWRAIYSSGHTEHGRSHRYFFSRRIIDEQRVRDEIVSAIFRSTDPGLMQSALPAWKREHILVPFKRAA